MKPELSLSVQYGVEEPRLPRWRLRRWAERALAAAAQDGLVEFSAANSACGWSAPPKAAA